MSEDSNYEKEMDFRKKLFQLITEEGQRNGKVISNLRIKWGNDKDKKNLYMQRFQMSYKFLPDKDSKLIV